jgi:hypothetical protein
MQPAANRHSGHSHDGRDLGRGQPFPAGEAQELAVSFVQPGQRDADSRNAMILGTASAGHRHGQLDAQPIGQAGAPQLAAALVGELTTGDPV